MTDANGESPKGTHTQEANGPSAVPEVATDGDDEPATVDGHEKDETESVKSAEQTDTKQEASDQGGTEQTEYQQKAEEAAEANPPQKADLPVESVEQTESDRQSAAEATEANQPEVAGQADATEQADSQPQKGSSPNNTTSQTESHQALKSTPGPGPETADPTNTPKPSPPATQDDLIIVPNITNPTPLEAQILAIHGQFKGARSINSWKAIRCLRNNQDMGSLWEMRQWWYLKQHK